VGAVFTLFTGTSGYFLMMTNETVLYNNIILKIGVLSLLLLLLFGYYYEVEGVAFIVSLSYIMKNLLALYFAARKLKAL
jgi:O-antigen/teichoic acid export membrane protein